MAKISIKKKFNVNDVALLLKMNGPNGSTSFIDSSKNNFPVHKYGNAQISTAQSKFDGSSAYFDGTANTYISAGSIYFETGDFTVEAWIYPTNNTKGNLLFGMGTSTSGILLSLNYLRVDGNLYNWNNNNYISFNTWSHIALVRNLGIMKIYVNGVEKFSSYLPNQFYGISLFCGNGYGTTGSAQNAFQGYVDNIRIIQGKAMYTSNFTPEQIYELKIKKVEESTRASSVSGLTLWLKADAGVALGGGNISGWADQSSNGNNAIGPSQKRPTYINNGINGQPAISFNGSTQYFIIADSNSLDITNGSIYMVVQRTGAGLGNNALLLKSGDNMGESTYIYGINPWNNGINLQYLRYQAAWNQAFFGTSSTNSPFHTGLSDNNPHIIGFRFGADQSIAHQDQYLSSPTNGATIISSNGPLYLGGIPNAQGNFAGKISEVIIFNKYLSDTEHSSLEYYLNNKYNIYTYTSSFDLLNGKLKIKTPPGFPIANLFAFWNLNESSGTRYDSSGNGRNLTQTFGTVSSTTGKIGNCAYFNGLNGGGSTNSKLGSTSFGVNPNSNFSMSVWMKPRSFSNAQHIIGAPFQNGFYIGANNSNLTFNLYNGTVYGVSAPSTALNTWHHYVFIREGSTLKLYADNTYIGSASVTGQSFPGASVFSVGGGEHNEYYFNGDIDALGLWTRALTESEITSLYNGGNGIES